MTEDENDPIPKTPSEPTRLSEEAVEQAKQEILFGTGYRRPPQHSRFRKGQSGNPKGRPQINDLGPANERSANAIALRECERLITVREGSETREMPAIEAVFRKQLATALAGHPYAQKCATQRYDWAERERRERISYEIAIYSYYVETQRAAIAEAKAKKQPPPDPLPHPDDVVLDPERGVRFVGPFTEEGRALIEENVRVRDALILQDALDRRMADKIDGTNLLDQSGGSLDLAKIMNVAMPERYRLSEMMIVIRRDRYATWSKRKLLKEVHRSWRSLGIPAPRGRTMGPRRYVNQKVDETFELLTNERHEDSARLIALPFHVLLDTLGIAQRKRREGERQG